MRFFLFLAFGVCLSWGQFATANIPFLPSGDTAGLGTKLGGKLSTTALACSSTVSDSSRGGAMRWGGLAMPATGTSGILRNASGVLSWKDSAGKTADSIYAPKCVKTKMIIVGTGTTALDSIRMYDGTYDTLFVGQGGKVWKFLPISNK